MKTIINNIAHHEVKTHQQSGQAKFSFCHPNPKSDQELWTYQRGNRNQQKEPTSTWRTYKTHVIGFFRFVIFDLWPYDGTQLPGQKKVKTNLENSKQSVSTLWIWQFWFYFNSTESAFSPSLLIRTIEIRSTWFMLWNFSIYCHNQSLRCIFNGCAKWLMKIGLKEPYHMELMIWRADF